MRIAMAQIDPVVGAFDENVRKIQEAYERACSMQARLLLTTELALCGYPPHDLVERPEIFERNDAALERLALLTKGKACALAVGHIARNPDQNGRAAQNVVTILENGKTVARQAKTLLPTYDVFDEARYFEPAQKCEPWVCDGKRVALTICEDLWAKDPTFGRTIYDRDPVESYAKQGVDLIISLSASPYIWEKSRRRESLHRDIASELGCPLIYVNQVGATDEVLFDGGSFACDAKGELIGRLPFFKTAFGVVELDLASKSGKWAYPEAQEREDQAPADIEILSRALVSGIQEYFQRTGFKTAILGLSGGIDSAVVATLAARALGPRNILGVAMPSQYSSAHSLEDAEQLARNLGINYEVRPIKFMFSTASRELSERRGELASLALENLQSRLRGVILMTLSNHYSALVLTTGNKSELAMGYCTMYGDMAGALAPLGDVLKTRVYELARYLNQTWGQPIPQNTLDKPPSAELRPGQVDQESLPSYEVLDDLLTEYLEKNTSVAEIESRLKDQSSAIPEALKTASKGWVREVIRKVELNEYKRRQAAPVLKVSQKAFGIGRRLPIAKKWES